MSNQGEYAILSVHRSELHEVAELRWDGASELIRAEGPERATMTRTTGSYSHIITIMLNQIL